MNRVDMVEVFIVTTVVSYLITPMIRAIAVKTGYMDHPKDNKVHAHPTALLGGVSIYIAFLVGIFTTVKFGHDPRVNAVLIGSTLLLVVGLIDDKMGMMPEVKLLAQFLAAMVVIKAGVRIDFLNNYYLNIVVTYLWIVGITNAFNLLDNMNGLSAGIAAIAAVFFALAMWSGGQMEIAVISFAIAGASFGFLRHNFPQAKIFMGDSGSLILGFLLASLAIMGSWSTRFLTTSLAMPLIIMAYPIFDTTLVTIMRFVEGRSIFQGGKDHSSHRLALLGLKKKRAVLAIFCICIALGFSALVVQRVSLRSAIVIMAMLLILMLGIGVRLALVDTGRFGRIKGKGKVG
jgi:UDP-GlcNAc:undecaprenyl-phosphate GlcNAc-1-phosphate transferase